MWFIIERGYSCMIIICTSPFLATLRSNEIVTFKSYWVFLNDFDFLMEAWSMTLQVSFICLCKWEALALEFHAIGVI